MFTGIIEAMATVAGVRREGSNIHFEMRAALAPELKVDQSLAHNGVCLTVTSIHDDTYTVTAIAETIAKTTCGAWHTGDKVNLERAMKIGDRLDGHFVQGHVDATAMCMSREEAGGSWLYRFHFPTEHGALVIEKGSVCINGVSLTAFDVQRESFVVAIIPYTFEHTNFSEIHAGTAVNIEFDVLGKYLLRQRELNK